MKFKVKIEIKLEEVAMLVVGAAFGVGVGYWLASSGVIEQARRRR